MFKDIQIIKNSSFKDNRGFLWTTWKKGVFNKIKFNFGKLAPFQTELDIFRTTAESRS